MASPKEEIFMYKNFTVVIVFIFLFTGNVFAGRTFTKEALVMPEKTDQQEAKVEKAVDKPETPTQQPHKVAEDTSENVGNAKEEDDTINRDEEIKIIDKPNIKIIDSGSAKEEDSIVERGEEIKVIDKPNIKVINSEPAKENTNNEKNNIIKPTIKGEGDYKTY